jgi:hypothetical protein
LGSLATRRALSRRPTGPGIQSFRTSDTRPMIGSPRAAPRSRNDRPAVRACRLGRAHAPPRRPPRQATGRPGLVPAGVHWRLNGGVQVAPGERREDPRVRRRLLRRQHRLGREEPRVRRVARPRLPDPERPRRACSRGLRRSEGLGRGPQHGVHRRGRPGDARRYRGARGDRGRGPGPAARAPRGQVSGSGLSTRSRDLTPRPDPQERADGVSFSA